MDWSKMGKKFQHGFEVEEPLKILTDLSVSREVRRYKGVVTD